MASKKDTHYNTGFLVVFCFSATAGGGFWGLWGLWGLWHPEDLKLSGG